MRPEGGARAQEEMDRVVDADGRGIVVESRTRGRSGASSSTRRRNRPIKYRPTEAQTTGRSASATSRTLKRSTRCYQQNRWKQPAFSHNFDELVTKLDAATGCAKDACVARISLKAGDVLQRSEDLRLRR